MNFKHAFLTFKGKVQNIKPRRRKPDTRYQIFKDSSNTLSLLWLTILLNKNVKHNYHTMEKIIKCIKPMVNIKKLDQDLFFQYKFPSNNPGDHYKIFTFDYPDWNFQEFFPCFSGLPIRTQGQIFIFPNFRKLFFLLIMRSRIFQFSGKTESSKHTEGMSWE